MIEARGPRDDEQPDWFANGEWGYQQADWAWCDGFEHGYAAALADLSREDR